MDSTEKLACELLEAQLRDSLRAPGFQKNHVIDAVRAARNRGVEVVLLDDHGMDGANADVRDRIHSSIVRELTAIHARKSDHSDPSTSAYRYGHDAGRY